MFMNEATEVARHMGWVKSVIFSQVESIQESTKQILWRTTFKKYEGKEYNLLKQTISPQIF